MSLNGEDDLPNETVINVGEKASLLGNMHIPIRRSSSTDDMASFEGDLTALSDSEAVKMINNSLELNEVPLKKSDALEDVFRFYSKLLQTLKEECAENSDQVSHFEDTYHKLVAVLNVKLKNNTAKKNPHYITSVVTQAKNILFRAYSKELVQYQQRIYGEETADLTERLICKPFHQVFQHNAKSPTEEKHKVQIEEHDDHLLDKVGRKESQKKTVKTRVYKFMTKVFPWLVWLPEYRHGIWQNLRGDLVAGLTVATLVIPQAMAYAILAGVPPIYGLYTSFMPMVIYTCFASSRHLFVGASAMLGLLVSTACAQLRATSDQDRLDIAMILALLAGIIQFLIGLLRLGFIVNLMSHPVLSGFTSAAAILIAMSQLKHILGINIPDSKEIHTLLYSIIKGLPRM
jgi:hypothetical protein